MQDREVVVRPSAPLEELDLLEKSSDHTADVTVAAADVVAVNKHRTGLTLINDSDTVIYLQLGRAAALNTGIRLNPLGGSYEIHKANMWKGTISAIHGGAGNKVLVITEIETRYAY